MSRPGTDRSRLLLLLALATAVTAFTATVPLLRDWFDLRVYYGAVDGWIHHGAGVYDYRVPGTPYGFTYPPFAAVLMLPMALIGLRTAIVTALLLNVAALAVAVRAWVGPGRWNHGWYGAGLAVCALALYEPLRDTFSFGQVNLLLLALVLTDARLLTTGRTRWAGVGIGVAAAVKLTPALFIGLLLVTRRVHHLVWLLPSFELLVRAGRPRLAGALYAVLCTSVVWLWFDDASGVDGFLGSNTYTWITLGLLVWLPVGHLPEGRRPAIRSTSATAAPPSTAAPPISAACAQPGTSATAAAGVAADVVAASPAAGDVVDADGVATATVAADGVAADAVGADGVVTGPGVTGTGTVAAGAGTELCSGPGRGPGQGRGRVRSASSEPTGSTRPAAANPQSSSARASS
nr:MULTISPECIES: glycosyltransferase family 87 protein [unclassified Streptomyces]